MSYSVLQHSFAFCPHRFFSHRSKGLADFLRSAVITLMLILTLVANLSGAVYRGTPFTYLQPDGSALPVQLWGDDDYADEETMDGWRIVRDPITQFWCYAALSADGMQLISTKIIAV